MSTTWADQVEAFVDVVYHDPELLQAEFAAIVAECWDDPPQWPARPTAPWPHRGSGHDRARPPAVVAPARRGPDGPGPDERGHQRAPPAHRGQR